MARLWISLIQATSVLLILASSTAVILLTASTANGGVLDGTTKREPRSTSTTHHTRLRPPAFNLRTATQVARPAPAGSSRSWTSLISRGRATKAGGGNDTTRAGRWMGREEHEAMQRTGRVQEGSGGVTSVARPANPRAYERQAASGSRYVEFDVPTGSLRGGGRPDWAVIPGPNSIFHRLSGRYPEMPRATCVEWRACRR